MRCRCTTDYPGCARGEVLFAALIQAQHHLNTASREDREEQWKTFSLARLAYLDHLHGWRQGDLRVRHRGRSWLVEQRQQDQWPLQFGTSDEAELQRWLRESFWRYAQLDGQEYRDRLTGYYHRRSSPAFLSESSRVHTRPPAQPAMGPRRGHTRSALDPSKEVARPELDCRTRVALMIVVQIGHASHPLTPLDHLTLQRKAVDLLLANGERIAAGDITWIQVVIEEAVRLRETLRDAQDMPCPEGEPASSPDRPMPKQE